MMNAIKFLILVATLSVATGAGAEIRPETRWADPDQVLLNVEFPGDGYHASWDVWRSNSGDLLVQAELAVPGEAVEGDLVLVSRRAVLSRGFGQYQAEAAASLDAAALMLQLTLLLLERSEPAGPMAIQEATEVNVEDTINPILLDTGGAAGGFQPPWSVSGTITPIGALGRRFDLTFNFTVQTAEGSHQGDMRLHGQSDFMEIPFPVADKESLESWNIDWRDPADAAVAAAASAKTLAELRDIIKQH